MPPCLPTAHPETRENTCGLLSPRCCTTVPQEYETFKTFTEVQRLVESKGLQPMVKVGCIQAM